MKKICVLLFILCSFSLFSAEKWTNLKMENGFSPKNDVTAIAFDRKGVLWIGTSYGVYSNDSGQWKSHGIENVYVQSLFIDKNDIKWIGSWGEGVCMSQNGILWEKMKAASQTNSVNVISSDQTGNIWFGDWGGGAVNLDGAGDIDVNIRSGGAKLYEKGHWISYTADSVKLGDNSVVSIACDAKNRMWFGTYHGVSVLQNNCWTLYNTTNSPLPDNDVYSLASDNAGYVWVGTCSGLAKTNGTKWTVYKQKDCNLPDNLILSIAVESDKSIWIGTSKGVAHFNGKKWNVYNTQNSPIMDDRIQVIAIHHHIVYFGTSRGISVLENK